MWSSLKLAAKELPRWPEVPKLTRWAGIAGVGVEGVVSGEEAGDVDEGVWFGEVAGLVGHVVKTPFCLWCDAWSGC